jgi:hypothetical protein
VLLDVVDGIMLFVEDEEGERLLEGVGSEVGELEEDGRSTVTGVWVGSEDGIGDGDWDSIDVLLGVGILELDGFEVGDLEGKEVGDCEDSEVGVGVSGFGVEENDCEGEFEWELEGDFEETEVLERVSDGVISAVWVLVRVIV